MVNKTSVLQGFFFVQPMRKNSNTRRKIPPTYKGIRGTILGDTYFAPFYRHSDSPTLISQPGDTRGTQTPTPCFLPRPEGTTTL